ncbi:peptide-methionine (S)-S-oxide reductase MsrA [Rhodospirillaceae bacterium SYSU D60014]|uniref:peptide-methionine (S)-S-oxide reductase MsrA n=1 Tax=Virgifigura deserti TaxID=2268457 RepID=UPI000E6762CC
MKQRWILSLAFAALIGSSAALAQGAEDELGTAVFAGGCFWCVEEAFDKVEGVVETTSGYTGGTVEDPTYQQVSAGGTGHAEAVQVRYDPAEVGYAELLNVFWHNVDPFDAGGQFCDRGSSYRSAIFVATDEQKRLAEASRQELADRFDRPVATEIVPADAFYPAEDYHQNYHDQNPLRYKFYKWNCGRAQRLEEIWGEPTSS